MTQEIQFQDGGEIREFVVPRPVIYVAVFYYPGSDTPWACTDNTSKESIIKSMNNWNGIDRTRPVRIYTITL